MRFRSIKSHSVLSSDLILPTGAAPTASIKSRVDATRNAQRIVVKCGTAIITDQAAGKPSISRLAAIVEQLCTLLRDGHELILVTSGAIGFGRQRMPASVAAGATSDALSKRVFDSSCAATGQLGLMSIYDALFSALDVKIAQFLVTNADFAMPAKLRNIILSIDTLLQAAIVPIVNENDVVSSSADSVFAFADNDELAMLMARHLHADLLIVLTNVPGVFTANPDSAPDARLVRTLTAVSQPQLDFQGKSSVGRGGMASKVRACFAAVRAASAASAASASSDASLPVPFVAAAGGKPVTAAFIVDGREGNVILRAAAGDLVGTMILGESAAAPELLALDSGGDGGARDSRACVAARRAREAQRVLAALSNDRRNAVLEAIAAALLANRAAILAANAVDMQRAAESKLAAPLLKRLALTDEKLDALAVGIRDVARQADPIGGVVSGMELTADGLALVQTRVPIGVLLVVFESRPDSLPQIAALAIKSGNAAILKGGSEAAESCAALHALIAEQLERVGGVSRDAVVLAQSRDDVAQLLQCDDSIDLVIPRGSNALVRHVKRSTRIPVLGHADGVCHVYVDRHCDVDMAIRLVIDAKLNYAAACNAAETLLLHKDLLSDSRADVILRAMRKAGIKTVGGPNAIAAGLISADRAARLRQGDEGSDPFHIEYGDETICVEVVQSVESAVAHVNAHGSGHTDVIVTSDDEAARQFCQQVDSACAFHNASSRFADGYRMGFGCEVGISTGRIHARGPVGLAGLVTTKYVLRGSGQTVGEKPQFTHRALDVKRLQALL